ncbi:hypothetical protein CkaCkLH20_04971 [Colletotrichum karsti]|uniref:Uncharacterized protein n=1 Tax=Colletotrichum karsti TaxID=1095194 RepID=A0A9P6IC67_9PEZI|nr:uncharacterized protein CkaCkLH20_04971 [Colletotrichum karsti]KAF9877836.1 hypothetical protein CkaCkLH20_04971 [Colletotrichum karsti]
MASDKIYGEGDAFHNALAFARHLILNQNISIEGENSSFYLSPPSFDALTLRLQSEPSPNLDLDLDLDHDELGLGLDFDTRVTGITSHLGSDSGFSSDCDRGTDHSPSSIFDKLRIEYDPDDGLLTFKMPETRIHTEFAAEVSHNIATMTGPFLKGFKARGNTVIELRHDAHPGKTYFKYPDVSWGRARIEPNPAIVAEVAYTNPRDLETLENSCQRYLKGTSGPRQVRTVLAFKIYYNSKAPSDFEAILDHLDECYAGV